MFRVRLVESEKETTVYSVKDEGENIMFLVNLGNWEWIDSCWFEPLN